MTEEIELIETLERTGTLGKAEWTRLLDLRSPEGAQILAEKARNVAVSKFGHTIKTRGLIEFTNYCRNDCYYCGIRRSNSHAQRYRLTADEILACCDEGARIGFGTFVLQGGEDGHFTDDVLCDIVSRIKNRFPDIAITLSVGERSRESYKRLFDAGADRYLLRHETANEAHYGSLHPTEMSLSNRKKCLYDLLDIGFETGAGFMVGSPHQTNETLAEDMVFLAELHPHMVGIGPFVPHRDTPFAGEPGGTADLTLYMLSLLRLMLPSANLPATTALGTIDPRGRQKGILAGANVLMPNLSPFAIRKKYDLYDNKLSSGDESAQNRESLAKKMKEIGYELE